MVGIPTVPYRSEGSTSFHLKSVKGIFVDTRYAGVTDTRGETLIPPTLYEFASTFADDLSSTLGIDAEVKKSGLGCASGGIFLTLGSPNDYRDAAGRPSSEGYTIVTNGSGITIIGASPLGVWWGTRTVLQQAVLSNGSSLSIPYGSGSDSPGWPTRGMMLDIGRHYYPPSFLTDMCAYMSFFKQNTFHLHLSDNLWNNPKYTKPVYLALYARFRLWSDDDAVRGLNLHRNESYDRETFDKMQRRCASRGVTILPEIEAPGHTLVVVQWKPQLAYARDYSLLNITHPEAIPTMQAVWATFLPWFHCKTVSIGADEYRGPAVQYNRFVNAMAGFVGAASGKAVRIWGTFPPRKAVGAAPIYTNVSVQHWALFEDDAYFDYVKNNYSVVNSNDDFYVVNKYGESYPNTIDLAKTFRGSPDKRFWRPNIFDQRNATRNPRPDNPFVLGSIVPLWNDAGPNATVYSEAYYAWRQGLPALADKQWGGNLSERAFARVFAALHPRVPAQNLERRIPSKSATIFNYTVGGSSSDCASSSRGGPSAGGPGKRAVRDTSPNRYDAATTCGIAPNASVPALVLTPRCSITTPFSSKGRDYTLAISLLVSRLVNETNATLVAGGDSSLMLTPGVTLLAGGNYYRTDVRVPTGRWFDLRLVGRGNRTFVGLDKGREVQVVTRMGIDGDEMRVAEIAIEAPLGEIGGAGSGWEGLFRGMVLTSTA